MRKIVLFLLLVLVLPFVSSFGVTPAQRVFGYEPGTEQKFSFEIINSEGKTFNLKIVPQGFCGATLSLPPIDSILWTFNNSSPAGVQIAEIPGGMINEYPSKELKFILFFDVFFKNILLRLIL